MRRMNKSDILSRLLELFDFTGRDTIAVSMSLADHIERRNVERHVTRGCFSPQQIAHEYCGRVHEIELEDD